MRTQELVQIKKLPIFRGMRPSHLESLLESALLQRLPAGVVLFHEGTQADFLYVLISGLIEIYSEQGGSSRGISIIRPVATFIPAAVIIELSYLSSARTLCVSEILFLPAARVRAILAQDIAFARAMTNELALAYRAAVKKLKGCLGRTSVERLANWILNEAETVADGGKRIVLPYDRGTLASHIGTSREALSRNLAQLSDFGIQVHGREIIIDDKARLRALARPQELIDDPSL